MSQSLRYDFVIRNMVSGSVLELVETKKRVMFPGCWLVRHEETLLESRSYAQNWRILIPLKMATGFDAMLDPWREW
jgi:hypothetical protein